MKHKQSSALTFDLFTPDVKMNFKRQGGVSTKVGTTLSVVFLGIFSYFGFLIISDFFDTSKPSISQSVQPVDLPPIIEFSEDKMFPMALFQYQTIFQLKKQELDRFLTVQYTKIEVSSDGQSGNFKTNFKDLKIVPCSDLIASGKTRSYYANTKEDHESLKSSGICVDPEDEIFTIGRRSETDAFFQNVIWRILPCTLPSGCATAEELAKVTFIPIVPKPIQDLANKKAPIRYVTIADEVHYLSTSFTSRQTYNLMKAEIIDEDGFLFGKTVAKRYSFINSVGLTTSDRNPSQLSCTSNDIEFGNCKPYFLLTFQTSPQKMVIQRKYKGMVETFSELGGMVDMLFMLFFFPYCIYNTRVFKEELVNEIFGMKRPAKTKIKAETSTGSLRMESAHQVNPISKTSYNEVFENIEDCLDIVHIYKELLQMKKLLNLQGSLGSKDPTFQLDVADPPSKQLHKSDAGTNNRIQSNGDWQSAGAFAQPIKHKNSITHQKRFVTMNHEQQSLKGWGEQDVQIDESEKKDPKLASSGRKIEMHMQYRENHKPAVQSGLSDNRQPKPANMLRQGSRDSLGQI